MVTAAARYPAVVLLPPPLVQDGLAPTERVPVVRRPLAGSQQQQQGEDYTAQVTRQR